MTKILMCLMLIAGLSACGSPDAEQRRSEVIYKGHPIDCIEVDDGAGQNRVYSLSCDFVGWHQRYDPLPAPTRQPQVSRSRITPQPSPTRAVQRSPRIKPTRLVTGRSAFERWRTSSAARAVAECESGGDPHATNPSGKYRGKWQMDADFWQTYGGLKFAARPDSATEYQQDLVAYKGWQARGWQPWECRKVL